MPEQFGRPPEATWREVRTNAFRPTAGIGRSARIAADGEKSRSSFATGSHACILFQFVFKFRSHRSIWPESGSIRSDSTEPTPSLHSTHKWRAPHPSESRQPRSASHGAFAASRGLDLALRCHCCFLRDCACCRSSFSPFTLHSLLDAVKAELSVMANSYQRENYAASGVTSCSACAGVSGSEFSSIAGNNGRVAASRSLIARSCPSPIVRAVNPASPPSCIDSTAVLGTMTMVEFCFNPS